MTEPRFTDPADPRRRDPIMTDPDPLARDPLEPGRTGAAAWGWVAAIAVVILIAFVLIGGWGWGGWRGNSVATSPAPITTGSPPAATR